MNKEKSFDCVEFQRKVRMGNYQLANGDFDLMISNMKDRLKDNELYNFFIERKKKEELQTTE
jgi:hypothetical protein